MRAAFAVACGVLGSVVIAAPCTAQGFGLGGRLSLVRGSVGTSTSAERFLGGLMRLPLSPRSALEISLDRRTESNDSLTERTVETPLQGTLLIYPVRATLSPYVLGGVGWYTQRVEQLAAGTVTGSDTSRRFGYHAGVGGELKLGRHAHRYPLRHGRGEERGGGTSQAETRRAGKGDRNDAAIDER